MMYVACVLWSLVFMMRTSDAKKVPCFDLCFVESLIFMIRTSEAKMIPCFNIDMGRLNLFELVLLSGFLGVKLAS